MDLPTCPVCKQSVLDDDAQDCPFCGSPLKGGPRTGPAPAPKTPVKKTPAAVEEAPKPIPAINRPAKSAAAIASQGRNQVQIDESIMEVSADAAKAVLASPTADKHRTLEVVCPMCETHGFVSPKLAGQAVKCCNPACIVPVFTAPSPEAAAPTVAPTAAPPSNKRMVYILVAGGLLLIGGLVYIFFLAPDPNHVPTVNINPNDVYRPKPSPGNNPNDINKPPVVDNNPVNNNPALQNQNKPREEILKERKKTQETILAALIDLARAAPAARKPYARRLSTVASLEMGDLSQAKTQLDQLEKLAEKVKDELLVPEVEFSWASLAAGNAAESQKHFEEAKKYAASLRKLGWYRIEASIALAALMVAHSELKEAREFLSDKHAATYKRLVSGIVIARETGSFNVGIQPGLLAGEWQYPLEAAVTVTLISRGKSQEAWHWAEQLATPAARAESLGVCAYMLAGSQAPKIGAAAAKHGPAEKARLWACLAAAQLDANQPSAAQASIKHAMEALQADDFKTQAPAVIVDFKAFMEWKHPDEKFDLLELQLNTLMQVETVLTRLSQKEQTWDLCLQGTQLCQSVSPSTAAVQAFVSKNENDLVLRKSLKSVLGLQGDAEVRRGIDTFKSQSRKLMEAGEQRLKLQAQFLHVAVSLGYSQKVWDLMQTKSSFPDALTQTALPAHILENLDGTSASLKAAVQAALPTGTIPDGYLVDRYHALSLYNQKKWGDLATLINERSTDQLYLHDLLMEFAFELGLAGDAKALSECLDKLKDDMLQEFAVQMAAASAAKSQKGSTFWTEIKSSGKFSSVPKITASAGTLSGLQRLPAPPAPAEPPPPEPNPKKKPGGK